jgi:hypothetical protein
MRKNYDELIDQNNSSFPDNTTGAITEKTLRDFHTAMLDSMAIETRLGRCNRRFARWYDNRREYFN